MSTQSRVAAGIPTGGQYATSARPEATVRLLPLSLEAAVPEDGSYDLPDGTGPEPFTHVSISRIRGTDSFRVTGTVPVDFAARLAEHTGVDRAAAADRLSFYSEVLDTHLDQQYAASLDDEEALNGLVVSTEVPCDADVTDATDALDRAFGVGRIRSSVLQNGFGARLAQALDRHERVIDDHAYGIHDDDPVPDECSECAQRIVRLDDMADQMRKGEW